MRALITGASSGIGRELARCFAADNYDLVITGRSLERLSALAAELRDQHHVQVEIIEADLALPQAARNLFETIRQRNIPIGFLINNAGFGLYGPFIDHDHSEEIEQIQLNVIALTELARLALPAMIERGHGRILNVASTAAFQPGPYLAVYSATKAYVLSFSEALGYEIRGTGVTVTCLCPGPTDTAFGDRSGFVMPEEFKSKIPGAAEVAKFGYDALFAGQPVAIHGWANRLLTFSGKLAPRAFTTAVSARFLSSGRAVRN